MSRRSLIPCAAIMLFSLASNASADFVAGEVWGVWNPAGSPYEVIGELEIPRDSTLNIAQGVTVIFNGPYGLKVNPHARLHAFGNATDSIIFTAADTAVGWTGIEFADSASAGGSIYHCRFSYGKATTSARDNGGAICVRGGFEDKWEPLNISHCTFVGNVATGPGGGGAIYIGNHAVVSINDCTFLNNHKVDGRLGGGAIYNGSRLPVFIKKNHFAGNTAEQKGGAIFLASGSDALVEYNLFKGNSAELGGAIYVGDYHSLVSEVTIINNTFYGNHADSLGGGIATTWGYEKIVQNNILWSNTAPSDPDLYIGAYKDTALIEYNDMEGGCTNCDLGNISEYPLFVAPPVNFELNANSPCIDLGSPGVGSDPDGTRRDMGAFYRDRYRWVWGELTVAESPYYLAVDMEIPAGSSLAIRPGVELVFPPETRMRVGTGARLQALGTVDNPIVFRTKYSGQRWGGIDFWSANPACALSHCIITNATYVDPTRPLEAGAIECQNSSLAVSNCQIYDNATTTGYGGAIGCYDNSVLTLSRSQIHHNRAAVGGAIYMDNSDLIANHNTIVHNTATGPGGGVFLIDTATADIQNCILYFDSASSGAEIYEWPGTAATVAYSDAQGGWTGTGNIAADPLLLGGDPFSCNMMAHSPCIDSANPGAPLDPDGTRADMGAIPYNQFDPGNMAGEWTLEHSPYLINSDVHVPAGSTLVIRAGVEVIFEGHYQFIVDSAGTIRIEGTEADSVLLTAADTTTGWGGLRLNKSAPGCVVQYCIIEGGRAIGVLPDPDGGGLFCEGCSPVIQHSRIRNCAAGWRGGAIAAHGGAHPRFSKCLIDNNQAALSGGAVYLDSADIDLDGCTVVENEVTTGSGGGIGVLDGSASVGNCIFWGNSVPLFQEILGGSVTATYSNIEGGWPGSGNLNIDPRFVGGSPYDYSLPALSPCVDAGDTLSAKDPDSTIADMGAHYFHHSYNYVYGQWTVAGSPYTISQDIGVPPGTTLVIDPGVEILFAGYHRFVVDSGAALWAVGTDADSITITAADTAVGWRGLRFSQANPGSQVSFCRLSYAKATGLGQLGYGGAIHCTQSPITISHCEISHNYAEDGGAGIYGFESDLDIHHNLVHHNQAVALGGGILCYWSDAEIVNNTIVANSASQGGGVACRYSEPALAQNILWGNTGGAIDYMLGEPTVAYSDVEGGFSGEGNLNTDPFFIDAGSENYGLLANSPCIDAGDPDRPYDADNTWPDLGALPYVHTGTDASGQVFGDWDRSNHPYYITADASVPADSSLTIAAGTIIYTQTGVLLTIDSGASLRAVGSEAQPITFTCLDTANGWLGLQLYYVDSTTVLERCIIKHAETDGSALHAALYLDHASPIIRRCTIRNNRQLQITGGGIRCVDDSRPLIEDCLIADNRSAQGGGGIFIGSGASPRIVGSTITGNTSLGSLATGGGILCESGSADIVGCVVSGNHAANTGGGIYGALSALSIQRTVVADNISTRAGGIGARGSQVEIINCTVAGHSQTVRTGAVYGYSNTNIQITNSILWDNTPAQIYLVQSGATVPCSLTISYTDFQGGTAAIDTAGTNYIETGSGNIDSDPLFADPQLGYLFAGSPCVDAGNPDVQYEDVEDPHESGAPVWPALGTLRNDMGAHGGRSAGIVVAVSDDDRGQLPVRFALEPNYPNPFNPQTLIRYSVPVPTHVRVTVYNILGRRVRTLVDEDLPAGTHMVRWDGANSQGRRVATGVYFYRIEAGDFSETRKMLMLK